MVLSMSILSICRLTCKKFPDVLSATVEVDARVREYLGYFVIAQVIVAIQKMKSLKMRLDNFPDAVVYEVWTD
jgi:hypothetical protein